MTLMEMRASYPRLFHPNQDWFVGEDFTKRPLATWPHRMPTRLVREPATPEASATTLAALYLECPTDPVWADYLWTTDVDSLGQRVYVGGTANGKGFEIHRHLDLTHRWSTPSWT